MSVAESVAESVAQSLAKGVVGGGGSRFPYENLLLGAYGISELPTLNGQVTNEFASGDAQAKQSNCGTFDEANDYVELSTLATASNFTIALWIKPTSVSAGKYISDFSVGNRFALVVGYDIGQFNVFGNAWPTGTEADSNMSATAGVWQHIAWSLNGTTLRGFLNGVQEVEVTIGAGNWSMTSALRIGRPYASATNQFAGSICDFRIYGTAKTESQMAVIASGGDDSVDLIAHLPFAEGAGTTAYDVSGNGKHGAATIITEASFWGTKQNEFHWNVAKGHSLYEHASTADILVPYKVNGEPLSITPPTGYSLTRNNPAVAGHNGAESQFDFAPTDSTVVTFPGSGVSINPFYLRETTVSGTVVKLDRFLVYSRALVGAEDAAALQYTASVGT